MALMALGNFDFKLFIVAACIILIKPNNGNFKWDAITKMTQIENINLESGQWAARKMF